MRSTTSVPASGPPGPRPRALAFSILTLAAALLAGCGSDRDVLARVGDETITTADFVEVARANGDRYQGPPEVARTMLLDDLVNRALLVHEARRRRLVPDTALASIAHATEEQLLLVEIQDRMAPRAIQVSDAEVARLYAWRDTQAHLQVIYVNDRAQADAARGELDRGVDFAAVADRFNPRGAVPPGGDLGFQAPGSLVSPLDNLLRTAPIGQVLGPVQGQGSGWFLVRVTERARRPQEPLPSQAPLLREMLRQRKQRLVSTRAHETLAQQYRLHTEPGGAAALFMRYTDPKANEGEGLFVNPPPPTPEQAARVLARWEDGPRAYTYTLGEAVMDLRAGRDAPNFTMMPAIEQWIESQAMRRIALTEARRRHLQEEPAVARRVRQRADNALLEAIYTSEVATAPGATEAEVRALYAQRADMFIRLDGARILASIIADSTRAAAVLAHAGHGGGTLREAVAMAAPGTVVTDRAERFPTEDPTWSALRATILGMAPGEYRGPFPVQGGWLVIQLVSKDQGIQPFENLPPQARQMLETAAGEQRRDQRLHELTETLRRTVRPVIHRDRLARVPWPVPPASTAS